MRAWQAPRPLSGGGQRLLFSRIFTIQALALVGLVLFALPLASSVGQATLDELLRPTSSATIYVRVLNQLVPQLIVFGVGLVIVEMVSAVATRTLLLQSAGFRNPGRARPPAAACRSCSPVCRPVSLAASHAAHLRSRLAGDAAGAVARRCGRSAWRGRRRARRSCPRRPCRTWPRDPGSFVVAFALPPCSRGACSSPASSRRSERACGRSTCSTNRPRSRQPLSRLFRALLQASDAHRHAAR